MSYDIVRGIKTADGKVMIKAASNNCYPHTYYEEELPRLTKLLQDKGQEAVDIEILKQYENGNFQPGTKNKYSRAVEVLLHMPEYEQFNWRVNKGYEENEARRKTPEFDALLLKALNTQLPKEKFVVTKQVKYDGEDTKVYAYHRKNAGFCKWYPNKIKAKIFNYRQDAEDFKHWFTGSENWNIETL